MKCQLRTILMNLVRKWRDIPNKSYLGAPSFFNTFSFTRTWKLVSNSSTNALFSGNFLLMHYCIAFALDGSGKLQQTWPILRRLFHSVGLMRNSQKVLPTQRLVRESVDSSAVTQPSIKSPSGEHDTWFWLLKFSRRIVSSYLRRNFNNWIQISYITWSDHSSMICSHEGFLEL